jgi:nitrogen regulatory protein PII
MAREPRVRLDIVIEEQALRPLLAAIEAAGASGYSIVEAVSGTGQHGRREPDHVSGVQANTIVFVLVRPEIADDVVAATQGVLQHFRGLVTTLDVTIHVPDRSGRRRSG